MKGVSDPTGHRSAPGLVVDCLHFYLGATFSGSLCGLASFAQSCRTGTAIQVKNVNNRQPNLAQSGVRLDLK
ncbi:MAG: hypothetical protein AAFV69_09185, partial [Pseudomonadota bacterium]